MSHALHGKSYLGNVLAQEDVGSFHAVSPLTNKPLEPAFFESTSDAVDRAATLADEAFTTYRRTCPEHRAGLLEKIAEEIMALGDDLLQRAHEESALPLDRLAGERGRTVGQLRQFAELLREGSWIDARIDTAQPDRKPLPKVDLRRMLIPLGPVAVFGASNFPLAFSVAGGDSASALASGCPIIVKGHPAHPGTSELVGGAITRAVQACQLPAGVFSLLQSSKADVAIALVKHPLVQAVGFTGSRNAGRALFDAAASRPVPIPVFAEMSSVNPIFLLPGALRERGAQLVDALRGSVTTGAGQFCTKPGLVFGIGGPDLQGFAKKFGDAMESTAPISMLHAGIAKAYHSGLEKVSKVSGVVSLGVSGTVPDPEKTQAEAVVLATDGDDFLAHAQLHEEVFGPYTLLTSARGLGDLIAIAQSLEGQLTATVHGTPKDLAEAGELLAILERKAGRLIINGFPTGVEVCPSMQHGGPYPATTDSRFTSVGTAAIQRWARPISYQNFPADLLPEPLRDGNAPGLMRQVNGKLTRDPIA